jgi:hypothetical protein
MYGVKRHFLKGNAALFIGNYSEPDVLILLSPRSGAITVIKSMPPALYRGASAASSYV